MLQHLLRVAALDLVAQIAKYPKCECFITFMYESVNRFLEHPNPKIQEHFTNLFGTDEARNIAALSQHPAERFEKITALYEAQLRAVAGFEFVRTFTMFNTGNRVEYVLCFGTHHKTGLSRMKSAMWKADPGDGCRFSDRTASGQIVLLQPEPDLALLEKLLRDQFQSKGFVSIAAIEDFVLLETPFPESLLRKATLAPMEKAIPSRIEAKGGPGRKKNTYPTGTLIRFL